MIKCGLDLRVITHLFSTFDMSGKITKTKGQIWQNKKDGKQFKITGKSVGDKWKAVELTKKHDYYASTHTFLPHIIRQKFFLIS